MPALLFALFINLLSAHPYYVSIFEVNHNPETKTIQVAARVFITDIEDAIIDEGKEKPHIGTKMELEQADVWIKEYLLDHFVLTANGKPVEFSYIGKESDTDVIWCYLESGPIERIDTLNVKADLLISLFPGQNNIVHTEVRGQKKSVILRKGKTEEEIVYGE